MPLVEEVTALYAQRKNCIEPYIGEAYVAPAPDDLRVMTVGINAYVSERHWPVQASAFREWFEQARHRFDRGVFNEASELAAALTTAPLVHGSRRFRGRPSFFHTNAIKVYLKEREGKRARQVGSELLADHAQQFRSELLILAKHGVLPHLLVVFGRPFWSQAWRSFQPGTPQSAGLNVVRYLPAEGAARHFANRVEIATDLGTHVLFLTRLRHPAGRSKIGNARWLLAQPGFQSLVDPGRGRPVTEYPPAHVALRHPIGVDFSYRGNTFVRREDGIHLVLPPFPDMRP